jgi:hypothetical protein
VSAGNRGQSSESTTDIARNTVRGEDLRGGLLDSNLFYQSEAAMIIQYMLKEQYLEEVSVDTYRKKKQWSREDYDEEQDNSKKEES